MKSLGAYVVPPSESAREPESETAQDIRVGSSPVGVFNNLRKSIPISGSWLLRKLNLVFYHGLTFIIIIHVLNNKLLWKEEM